MKADRTSIESPTRTLADYVSRLRYEDVPAEVLERLKLLMLDAVGCGLYGARLEWSRILLDTLSGVDETRKVGVWGTSRALSAPHAALVNGTQVQGFELDDVHRVGVMHVGAVTLPALLGALAGRRGVTGRDFLAAALAGYEVGPRVGICMGQEHIGQGWHSGATLGVFSAAAAAARGLGLDPERTVHALGIAGTQSAGLMAAQFGSMVKRMHAGRSAQSGLYGALLAENGFTGIVDVFEAPYGGFCTTFSRSDDRFDLSALTAGLGETFETMRIALKFYSCVGSNHTTLDAIRDIRKRRPFTADEVREIRVHGSQVTVDHVGWDYQPQGLTSAQLNLPFCVATLMLEGDVFVEQFTDEAVDDRPPDRVLAQGRGAARPGDHRARREVPAQGPGRGRAEGRHRPRGDPRGAGRQRAFLRGRGRHRRQVPQADAGRAARGAARRAGRAHPPSRASRRRGRVGTRAPGRIDGESHRRGMAGSGHGLPSRGDGTDMDRATDDPAPSPVPTMLQLFLIFARIGLTSFGGGLSGWFLREFVRDRKWMTEEEFLNGLSLSQALPGVNVTNMAIWIGYRMLGLRGAVAGFCGIIIPPAIVIVLLSVAFASITAYEATQVALRGAAAAAIGLSLSLGLTAARRVRRAVLPAGIMVATFVAVGLLHLPLLWVVVVAGAVSVAAEHRRIRRHG